MLLPESKVRITIVDNTTSPVCNGNCGMDWSSVETQRTIKQQIIEKFGSDVDLDYIDLSKAEDTEVTLRAKSLVSGLPIPVLLVNERPRIAGEFDSRQLMDVIEVEMEAGLYERS